MSAGNGIFQWLQGELQPLVLCAIILTGGYFFIERKFTKIVALVVIGVIAVGFVFATTEVKDMMLRLFKQIFK